MASTMGPVNGNPVFIESSNRNTGLNGTLNTTNIPDIIDRCLQGVSLSDYQLAPSVVCSSCTLLGLLYLLVGYRLFRAIMFLTGFVVGSVISYVILEDFSTLQIEGNAGIAVGIGILCGLITMLVQTLGIFVTGFKLGLLVSAVVLVMLEEVYHPESKWIALGVMLLLGSIFGGLGVKFQKTLTILGTSVFGAALMLTCLDYFTETFIMAEYILDRLKVEVSSQRPCWYSWVVLGCWPLVSAAGFLVQYLLTAKNYDHKQARPKVTKSQKLDLQRLRSQEAREVKQSRYRHLYQIRRSNGDVISKDYIQGVQDNLSPALRNFTNIQGITELDSTNTTLTQLP